MPRFLLARTSGASALFLFAAHLGASPAASAQRPVGRPAPSALAQKCGDAVPWRRDFATALEDAARLKKPLFWYVATVPNSPMDRKDVVDMYMRAGPFSAPAFVDLLKEATIPVRLDVKGRRARRRDAGAEQDPTAFRKYDVAAPTFVEPGFVLLSPNGEELFRVDRLSTFHEGWLVDLVRRELEKAGFPARKAQETPDTAFDEAFARFAAGAYGEAVAAFARVRSGDVEPRARLFQGMAAWRSGARKEAEKIWIELGKSAPKSPFAWKAAAEAEGFGPFVRGFEEFGPLVDEVPLERPDGTRRERVEADAEVLAARCVDYLIAMQGSDGGFEDSIYDFGGKESLPDVHVAVTAVAGRALLRRLSKDDPRVEKAVRSAFDYVLDERRCSSSNTNERMWAHAYRLLFLKEALDRGVGDAPRLKKALGTIVKAAEGLQEKKGAWAHEYANPFVTALTLHALNEARAAGAKIDPARFDAGIEALASCRGDDGTFSYGFPGRGSPVVFAAGRGPHAEFALKLGGRSDDARVVAAIRRNFAEHAAFEAARKYDDHAPPHQIGGFFFFYDEMHRVDAIKSLADKAVRGELLARQREILLRLPEIDGRFVDSHELGKSYGTASGLYCLMETTPEAP